jgi:segregation and condensation protein B
MDNIRFENLSIEEKKSVIEALIFASDSPLDHQSLFQILNSEVLSKKEKLPTDDEFTLIADKPNDEFKNEVAEIIQQINLELEETGRPYQIVEFAGGWQFSTRKEYGRYVHYYYRSKLSRRLSNAALEVLSIVAYRQPITKAEIEQIRGVNSNEVVNSLLDKSFIKIAGRKNVLGRPLVFEITEDFMRTFGLNSLEDLPKMKDFEELVREEFAKSDEDIFTLDVSEAELEHKEAEVEEEMPEEIA